MTVLAAIKIVAVVAIACLLFFGGRSCGVQSAADRLAAQARVMAAKDRALQAAARSFAAFADTFRAIDAHTAKQVAEAARREAIAVAAGGHAAAAEAEAVHRAQQLERDLAAAKARRPATCAFFDTDLKPACGVTLR